MPAFVIHAPWSSVANNMKPLGPTWDCTSRSYESQLSNRWPKSLIGTGLLADVVEQCLHDVVERLALS